MKNNKKIFLILCLTLFYSLMTYGQNDKPQDKSKEPVLIPLTEVEKKINPKDIVSNQPDFMATEIYFSSREISGFSSTSKVARKGNKFRTDTGFVVVITEPKKTVLRLNKNKTYEESVAIRKPFVSPTSPLNPTDLLGFEDVSLSALGTIEVDGSKLLKIQAKSKEFDQEVFLYADMGKKNLVTIIQILSPRRSSVQRLQEISFEVPAEFFDISGYRELPKFKWNKVKTAKVFYKGNLLNDALVFRYDNYIFIHVAEFEHFLIDLKKKIADTVVFQGLLVAQNGSYIWRTKEDEAISVGEPDGYIESDCDSCVKIQSESNSLTIPDRDNKSKTLVKITW